MSTPFEPVHSRKLVLDSHAMLSYFEGETGADFVANALSVAQQGKLECMMTIVNWGEVYYSILRTKGEKSAQEASNVLDQLPIEIVNMDMHLVKKASHFREQFRMANGHCFAASLAQSQSCPVMTGDQAFKRLEDEIQVLWLK